MNDKKETTVNTNSYQAIGLADDTEYNVFITNTVGNNESEPSEIISVKTLKKPEEK